MTTHPNLSLMHDWERALQRCRDGHASSDTAQAQARQALDRFPVASLELLKARALQKRVDTKFLVPVGQLAPLLKALEDDFAVVHSAGVPVAHYETVYYDTPERLFYRQHVRGRRPRTKVRVRRYVERELCYLEVKTKDKYNVTSKFRRLRPSAAFDLTHADRTIVDLELGGPHTLVPTLRVDFPRVTLVGRRSLERLTIDLGVRYDHDDTSLVISDLLIVELKQARFSARTPGMQALREVRALAQRMSKYGVGVASLVDDAIPARFRPTVRALMRSNHA